MSDLISRQAAIDATWKEPSYTDPLNVLTEVRDRIEALPSADVELVRHGRWEAFYAEELCGYRRAYYVCSNCFNSSDDEFDYCPNCGAKMEG